MNVFGQIGLSDSASNGRPPGDTFTQDAEFTIAFMGDEASRSVTTGSLMHFGGWAGWPAWLRDGSSLGGSGPLPQRLTVADDLRVLANLLDHGKLELLVDRVARNVNQPIGPLGALSLANAPTLFDALGSLARLSNIHRKYFDASVAFEGEMAVFLLERRLPATRLADVIALLTLLVAERLVSSYTNETESGIEVSCSFLQDPPIPIPPALPGIEYRLGADRNTVRFPSSWLDRETGLSDARLWRIAQELVASAEAQEADHPILADVRKRTAQILAERRRVPRLKEMVADGNSARTFARILASQGTSYRAVVESERRKQALKLINDPSLALDEIAEALGFPDKSSFGRSFRRWFGQTPGQFRSARK